MSRLLPVAAALMLSALSLVVQAGEVRVFRSSDTVDPGEVARILDHSKPLKMRSLHLLDDATGGASEAGGPAALSVPIQFAFDSAEILPSAKAQLDAIAAGIRMLPLTQKVVIEGHTDNVGTEQYNEQLSQRRALSVRRYLVATHGIESARLEAVGKGEQAPLPGRGPAATENRRVQFRGQ
jgi:outer membrane protein OmpA-like peptidoglycan-associated protein